MRRYFDPIGPVSSAPALTTFNPQPAPQQSTADSALPQPGATPAVPVNNQGDLQSYLDSALKNSTYKAEINIEQGGYTVLKVVDSDTGATILQLPTQTVLDLIANMEQQDVAAQSSAEGGAALINRRA